MNSTDFGLLGAFAVYCLPLLLIAGACFAGSKFVKRKWAKLGLLVLTAVIGTAGTLFAARMGSYLWALHLEEKWRAARPTSQTEMESHLSLYRTGSIQPKDSMWGNRHELKDGERMTQYMILWGAPLDVVYDRDNRIVSIYTSYE